MYSWCYPFVDMPRSKGQRSNVSYTFDLASEKHNISSLEEKKRFICRWLIVRVCVVLGRTVVGCDRCFDNLCRSHLQKNAHRYIKMIVMIIIHIFFRNSHKKFSVLSLKQENHCFSLKLRKVLKIVIGFRSFF